MPFDDKGNWYPPGGFNTGRDMRAVKDYGMPPAQDAPPQAPPTPNFRMLEDQSLTQPMPPKLSWLGQKNKDLEDWMKTNPVTNFLYGASQRGTNILFNGGQPLPGQELFTSGNKFAAGAQDLLGYGALALNPASGLQRSGTNIASQGLAKLAPSLSPKLNNFASNVAGSGALGVGFGAQKAGIQSLQDPNYTFGQGVQDTLGEGLLFAGGDAALRGLGMGAKSIADSTGMTQWAKGLIERFRGPQQEFIPSTLPNKLGLPQPNNPIAGLLPQQKIAGLLPEPPKPDFIAGFGQQVTPRRLTPETPEQLLYRVLAEIEPDVRKAAGGNVQPLQFTKSATPSSLRAVNTQQKAAEQLQQAIEAAQNYVGHSDILAAYPPGTTLDAAFADIKANTGIDLLALSHAANVSSPELGGTLRQAADISRMGRTAGVFDSKTIKADKQAAHDEQVQSVVNAAYEAAAKRGYNLDELFAKAASKPGFVEQATPLAERNRLTQAAGVMDRPTIGRGPTQQVPFVQQNMLPPQLPKASGAPLQAANPFPANAIPIKPPALGKQASNMQGLNIAPNQAPLKNNLLNPLQLPKQAVANISPMPEVAATRETALNAAAEPDLIHVSNVPKAKAEQTFKAANVDPTQWKDKAKPFLVRETMQRNFEDIMGKDAPAMKQQYLDPIKKSEADRIRFLNTERDNVKKLGIKFSSKDDELVQKYGEGLISESELQQLTPNWQQVKNTAEAMRAKYDQLLTTVNQTLERNGYDPIPKRDNYFPHYEEIDSFLAKALGIKIQDFSLPTDINGLTADLKPGKNFFSNALKRKGNETQYGFIQGFDKYAEGVSKVIYHTDNIKRLRGLETALRDQFESTTHLTNFVSNLREYTNILAGKKSMIDRGAEDIIGRRLYSFADSMRKKVGANMIGGNIASAVTNFIPLTQAAATTEKTSFVKGMLETIGNVGRNDGFTDRSDFLTKRIGSDPLAMTMWDKTIDKAGWLFKTVDNFVSQTIVRGKYNELVGKGISSEQAMKQADDWAGKILADRSAGSMPTLFDSRTLGLLTQFQLEVNNQMSFLGKDIPRNFNKVGAASALGQVFIYSYLFNNLYENVIGRRPALDPIGVAERAYKNYTNPNLETKDATTKLRQDITQQLPFASVLTGGRIPVQAAMPNFGNLFSGNGDLKKDLIKPLMNVLPPVGGSQLMKTYEGARAMGWSPLEPQKTSGSYDTNPSGGSFLKYPIAKNNENIAKGLIFGPNSLPETQQYYDNNRRPLSPEQTKKLEVLPNRDKAYNNLMVTRRLDTLEGKMGDITKDRNLSKSEKIKKIEELKKQYQEAKKQIVQ